MSRLAPLRSLVAHVQGDPALPALARQAADALALFLAGEAPTLEDALGVRAAGSQGPSARTIAMLAERDRLLREAARDFLPDLLPTHQARELHTRLTRYRASGWNSERALDAPPLWRAGSLEARLWAVLRLRDFVPSERTIRATLAAGRAFCLPPPPPILAAED